MRKYEAPALDVLAVEAVNVLLASGLTDGGAGTEDAGGDIVIHMIGSGVDIFR